jgi:hypothetical protein
VNAGQATITLANEPAHNQNGGIFSPWNTNSPYTGGIRPGVPVWVKSTWSGITYSVFYGYAKGWVPQYGQARSTMQLQVYDGLALLNLNTLDSPGYAALPISSATSWWPLNDGRYASQAADQADSNPGTKSGTVKFAATAGPFLTANDTATETTPGSSLSFNGNLTGFTALTVDGWINTSQTVASVGTPVIFSAGTLGAFIGLDGSFHASGTILTTNITGSDALNDGRWHYLALTWDGATMVLYVDGVEVSSTPKSGSQGAGTGVLALGAGTTGQPTYFAQIALYAAALTSDQIANQYQVGRATWIVQDSGARVEAVLGVAGVPATMQNVETGTTTMQAATSSLATTTVMSYLNQVAASERGFLYQDHNGASVGAITFYSREHVYETPASTTTNAFYNYTGASVYQYLSGNFTPAKDDLDLWNNIPVNRQGGIVQLAQDVGSQSLFGRRTLTGYTSMLFEFDADSFGLASGLLYQYKEPKSRVRSLTQDSTINSGANMPQMLGRQLLDRITVNWQPIDGSGVDFVQDCLIEMVTHSVSAQTMTWTTTWALTPIGTEGFWTLGSSQLGSTTILGF